MDLIQQRAPGRGGRSEYLEGEKSMAMKLVKKTAEYSIFKRGDDRYAVKDANKRSVNAEEKVRILLAEGLISAALPAEPEPEAEEAAAEVPDQTTSEEAPAEDAAAEEAPAEEEAPAAEEPAAEESAEEEDK
jgi:hypothetical protein